KILPLLRNVGFTRLDFAFDVEADLADYIYFDGNSPKKVGKYIGKNGKLETMYIGSKESEWHVCIYDKKKEKMKELSKEERALAKGKEYYRCFRFVPFFLVYVVIEGTIPCPQSGQRNSPLSKKGSLD